MQFVPGKPNGQAARVRLPLYYRWWRFRKVLLLPVVNYWAGVALAIASFILGVGALQIVELTVAGWALTALGFVAASAYLVDTVLRHLVMHYTPTFEKDIRPENFLHAPQRLTDEYRIVMPRDSSEDELYPYVDLTHYSPHIRAEYSMSRQQRYATYARWHRLCPHGFMHLEKLVDGQWRPIAVSEILPLSLEGYHAITRPEPNLQLKVIDLDRGHILTAVDKRFPVLLINIWAVDRAFKGTGHGKAPGSGGFANTLVLRHAAQFWNSRNRFPSIAFLVESSNKHLINMLLALMFRPSGRSRVGVDLYQVERDVINGLAREDFKRLREAIKAIESIEVHVGTASRPGDWNTVFPSTD